MSTRTRNTLNKLVAAGAMPLILAFGLAACEVEQTEEGEAPDVDIEAESGQMPEYEQTQEGELPEVDVDTEGGDLPAWDIDAPNVNVAMEERTVTVPKVVVVQEEEQVTVPHVSIDFPEEEEIETTVGIEVEVPNEAYEIEIEEIYLVRDHYLVVSQLERTDGSAEREIRRVTDHAVITGPELEVRHVIIGQKPDRKYNDRYTFVDSRQAIETKLQSAQLVYERGDGEKPSEM